MPALHQCGRRARAWLRSLRARARPPRRAPPGLFLFPSATERTAPRPDCLGHVRFELRNVGANYPFESSRGFPGSEPNSGQGDHSRLSCSAGHTQLGGWVLPGSSASVLHGRWPSCGVAEKARIGRDLFRSEDDPRAAKPSTPLLSLRWTFRAKRACVVITDTSLTGLLLSPRQRRSASAGFGWWWGAVLRQPSGALLRRRS